MDAARLLKLSAWSFIALVCSGVAHNDAQPLVQVQQFLQDYARGVRTSYLSAALESDLVASLLTSIPAEPPQFAGNCNITYDPTADTENRFAILLPPEGCSSSQMDLPSVDAVWQALLARQSFQKSQTGINFLLVSFANWFLDDLFQTSHGTNGTYQTPGQKLVQGHLYGRTPDRELALRAFTDGKMKVSHFNGTDYPPLLSTIQQDFPDFSMDVPAAIEIDTNANVSSDLGYFATGDPRFNMHLGHLFWATKGLQLHNSLCDLVLESQPAYTDQQVFETSRLLLSHFLTKVLVEEYISKAVSPFRNMAGLAYDPDVMRTFSYPALQNQIYMEFDHLYRWHSLIPDVLNLAGGINFPDVVFQPQVLLESPLEQIQDAFINTTAGAMTAKNTPLYLYPITVQTMLDARAQGLQGFNAYRQAFELPKFTSFEDFGLNASLTGTLSKLYNNDIDQVEWFVGLMIESPAMSASFLAETMVSAVATFAVSAIWNTDLVKNPLLWSPEHLTPAGKAWVESTSFQDWLGVDLEVPFFTPDMQPSWTIVNKPSLWRFSNLRNFVGRDYAVASFFSSGGDFHMLFNTTLLSAVSVILVFVAINCFWRLLGKLTIFPQLEPQTQLVVTMHSAFAVITTLQLVPYTVFALPMWFGPDFIGQVENRYTVLFTFFIVHGVMYICEATTRAVIKLSQLLLWHHALWFIFIFIASVKRSVFAVKLDFILDYFVCWEFALYLVLIAYRLKAKVFWQQVLLGFAAVTYGVSRVVQLILVIGLFVLSFDRMKPQPAIYYSMLILTIILIALQTYTGYIYWGIWTRVQKTHKELVEADSASEASVNQD